MPRKPPEGFRVYCAGEYPEPKRRFHPGVFPKRQKARQWCRNRSWMVGLSIVHPDGFTEPWKPPALPQHH
jgi:hypothetical protein